MMLCCFVQRKKGKGREGEEEKGKIEGKAVEDVGRTDEGKSSDRQLDPTDRSGGHS